VDEYEVLVIGSGSAGRKAAVAASKLGRRAAIIERADMLGGVCVNTGTIPSVLHLTGMRHREHYGTSYRVKEDITVQDLGSETRQVVAREMDVVRDQLARNHIALLTGTARFDDPHTVAVTSATREWRVRFDTAIIAAGTRPARPASVNFDGRTVVDSDGVLALERIPASLVVVGAGVVGVEYASVFAALGTKVTVVESRASMLDCLRRAGRRGAALSPP
jgi:NAD(P) transhydrogenase